MPLSPLIPPAGGATVRMFCQGLGDCFLLALDNGGTPFYVVFDCGVIVGTPNPVPKMRDVVQGLRESCGGHIHRLIISHEHYDHVGSFDQVPDEWEKFDAIEELWFAWTEDPANPYAQELRSHRERAEKVVRAAADQLDKQQKLAGTTEEEPIQALLGFLGVEAGSPQKLNKTAAAMQRVANIVRDKNGVVRYLKPPDTFDLLPGVRVAVLGPPQNDQITKSDPTRAGNEVYSLASEMGVAAALEQALGVSEGGASEMPLTPFDRCYTLRRQDADAIAKAPPADHPLLQPVLSYLEPENAWRNIDTAWLASATVLGLALDSDTNNTSLALAIHLEQKDQVLLFPADAQVGNWESWGDGKYALRGTDGQVKDLTIDELLAKVTFYKVGHHGSHNATHKARGLELMTHPELTAMIPVDIEVAHGIKHWNKMPFSPLMQALGQRTKGRMIQLDAKEVADPFRFGPTNDSLNRQLFIDLDR